MNTFSKITFFAGLLMLGMSTIYAMEPSSDYYKNYYKLHYLHAIKRLKENPSNWATKQLSRVEEGSPAWQALQEIIQENTTQTTTITQPDDDMSDTKTPTTSQKRPSSTDISERPLKRAKIDTQAQQLQQHIQESYKKAISMATQQGTPLIWVKTSDNRIMALSKWQIDEMKLLQLLLAQQKNTNSQQNPIILPENITISSDDFALIAAAFDKAALGEFDNFYDELAHEYSETLKNKELGEGQLRRLVTIAQQLEASGMSALSAKEFFKGVWLPENPLTADMFNEIQQCFINRTSQFYFPQEISNMANIQFSADGRKIIIKHEKKIGGNTYTGFTITDLQSRELLEKFSFPPQAEHITFSPSTNKIFYAIPFAQGYGMYVFDASQKKRHYMGIYNGALEYPEDIQFSPDENKVVVKDPADLLEISIWDIPSETMYTIPDVVVIKPVLFDQAKNTMSYAYDDKDNTILAVEDLSSGKRIHSIDIPGRYDYAKFSPDGNLFVTYGDSFTVWDVQSGKQIHNFETKENIYDVQFSPDGNKIILIYKKMRASESEDQLIVLNVRSGQQIHNLIGHKNNITAATFSPTGEKIIAVSYENDHTYITLWDAASGKQLHTISLPIHINLFGYTSISNKYFTLSQNENVLFVILPEIKNIGVFYLNRLNINDLNLEQIQALYQWCLAAKAGHTPRIMQGTRLYAVYQSLPDDVKELVHKALHLNIE